MLVRYCWLTETLCCFAVLKIEAACLTFVPHVRQTASMGGESILNRL